MLLLEGFAFATVCSELKFLSKSELEMALIHETRRRNVRNLIPIGELVEGTRELMLSLLFYTSFHQWRKI